MGPKIRPPEDRGDWLTGRTHKPEPPEEWIEQAEVFEDEDFDYSPPEDGALAVRP